MSVDKQLLARALNLIQVDRLVQTCCDLINIPSPTGFEKQTAEYLLSRYQKLQMRIIPQQVETDRFNAVGICEGTGTGPTLMFCGHLDTSYSGSEAYLPNLPAYQPKAHVEGDWIFGLGAYNMKSALGAYLEAIEVLREMRVPLKGDICIAGVCGEIEKSQVDQYQGPLYRGGGLGAWYALTHGALADFAVIGEQTSLGIQRASGGYVYTKITLNGLPAHTIFGVPSSNVIHNMVKVIHAIEEWGEEYAQRASYLDMPAKVTLSAIEGGWPYRASRVPIYCSLFVDTRLLPGQNPIQVKREIQTVVGNLIARDSDLATLESDVQVYMSQYGAETSLDELIYRGVQAAHRSVFGLDPEVFAMAGYTDATELIRHGIPVVIYGPGGRTPRQALGGKHHAWDPQVGESQSIEDLINCTKVYLSLILDVCSKSRVDLGIS